MARMAWTEVRFLTEVRRVRRPMLLTVLLFVILGGSTDWIEKHGLRARAEGFYATEAVRPAEPSVPSESYQLTQAAAPDLAGRWVGEYRCGQRVSGLALTIEGVPSHLIARFHFFPVDGNPGIPEGEYEMVGGFDFLIGELRLRPVRWTRRPGGYVMVGLRGMLQRDGTLSGRVSHASCQEFRVTRAAPAVESVANQVSTPAGTPETMCAKILAWARQAGAAYPELDMKRTSTSKLFPIYANLYRDESFVPVFGVRLEDSSSEWRRKMFFKTILPCSTQTEYRSGYRDYITVAFNPFHLATGGNLSFENATARLRDIRQILDWRDRVLSAADGFDASVESFDALADYIAQAEVDLAALWPHEASAALDFLREKQRAIAAEILAGVPTRIGTLDVSVAGVREAMQAAEDVHLVAEALPEDARKALLADIDAEVTRLSMQLVTVDLTELQSLPPTPENAVTADRWLVDFQTRYAPLKDLAVYGTGKTEYENWRQRLLLAYPGSAASGPQVGADQSAQAAAPSSAAKIVDQLRAGERVKITPFSTLVLGGIVDTLGSRCPNGLGLADEDARLLKNFATNAALKVVIGDRYSDSDFGQSIEAMELYGWSGEMAHNLVGCGGDATDLLESMAASVRGRDASSESGIFIRTCQPHFSLQQCGCLLREGRSQINEMENKPYHRDMIVEIVQGNPFIGIKIGLQCQISNY